MQRSKPKWKGLLKLLGPIFFIYIIVKVVDPETTANLLKGIQPEIALISMLLFPILISVLTARWWMICKWLEMGVPYKRLFQIYYISWFLGLIPVIGVAQMSKFVYLKADNRSAGATAVTIILDKIFDIIGHLIFGLFALIYFPTNFLYHEHVWISLTILLLAVFAILIYWNSLWNKFTAFLKNIANRRIQKIGKNLEIDLSKSWSRFNLKFLSSIFSVSIAIGILRALVLFLLALSLDIHLSFVFIIACRALIGIVSVIPVTINSLGTRDAILLLAFPLVGVSKEAAVALSFVAFLWILCFRFSGIILWLKYPLPSSNFSKNAVTARASRKIRDKN